MPRPPRKKPPAASVPRRWRPIDEDAVAEIAAELYAQMERLGADEELLSIVGSMRDTLSDAEVLALLRQYRASGDHRLREV